MKTSTLLLITILPIELMTLLLFFLPEKHLITGIMMMALYFGIIMLISGKYIKRGDNAHLISDIDISYEEAKIPTPKQIFPTSLLSLEYFSIFSGNFASS